MPAWLDDGETSYVEVERGHNARARKIFLEGATWQKRAGRGCLEEKMPDPDFAAEEADKKMRNGVRQETSKHPGTPRLLVTAENTQIARVDPHPPRTMQKMTGVGHPHPSHNLLSTVTLTVVSLELSQMTAPSPVLEVMSVRTTKWWVMVVGTSTNACNRIHMHQIALEKT